MKFLVVVVAGLLVASASARIIQDSEWEAFKLKHNKVYKNAADEKHRYGLWKETSEIIAQHNARYESGEVSYFLGMNHLGDMTHEERKALNGHQGKKMINGKQFVPTNGAIPESVDWRKEGVVNAVKNQAQCGSCWAFSAIASLEGQYALKNKKLLSFSEQEMVDCVPGSYGCNGGLMDFAFNYLKSHGLESEDKYPYLAETERCSYNKSASVLDHISGFVDIPSGDEKALTEAIAKVGPISVAIDASHYTFQLYAGGVYDDPNCSHDLDHGVAAIGYGSLNGKDYYIVRNSWGPGWGMEGYILMARNDGDKCGIAIQASYPTL